MSPYKLYSDVLSSSLPNISPHGTGKTSMILALAREHYGEYYQSYITEINGSSERGIDTIRVNVMNFIQKRSDRVKPLMAA